MRPSTSSRLTRAVLGRRKSMGCPYEAVGLSGTTPDDDDPDLGWVSHPQLDFGPFGRSEVGSETALAVLLGVPSMPRAPGHPESCLGVVSGVLRTPLASQGFEKAIASREPDVHTAP